LLFVYLPSYSRYQFLGDDLLAARDDVLSTADSLGIPVLDLHTHFVAAVRDPRDLWVNRNSHLNPRGYSVVAEAVRARIAPLLEGSVVPVSTPLDPS
jgi:lysophospholipase L1-like esterase